MGLLEKLIKDPKVLYVYEIGLQIYGLFPNSDDRDFLVICENGYRPQEFSNGYEDLQWRADDDQQHFNCISIADWFRLVMNGEMLAWECACLPKKFVHKEHVKLTIRVNPLQLRKNYDTFATLSYARYFNFLDEQAIITAQKELFNIAKYLVFANQIIENHKIVNFKEIAQNYRAIVTGMEYPISDFNEYIEEDFQLFKKYTDGALRNSKIKKIIQK